MNVSNQYDWLLKYKFTDVGHLNLTDF